MLHASMRRLVRMKNFDVASYGLPINQVDLARTWMDFTKTSFKADACTSYPLSCQENDHPCDSQACWTLRRPKAPA